MMKKFSFALTFALLVGAMLSTFAFAGTGTTLGNPQRLLLSRTAVAHLPISDGRDTCTILSTADSVRTSAVSTTSWNWGMLLNTASATSVTPVAKVEVWADPGTTSIAAGDSLNFVVEPSFDGGSTFINNTHPKATAMGASALGNCIVMRLQNGTLAVDAQGLYGSGYLCIDPDAGNTLVNQSYYVPMLRTFRLKLFGDSGPIGPLHVSITPLAVLP